MNNYKDFYEQIFNSIEKYGRHIIGVFSDGDSWPFCYTVGNAVQNLPELLMIGICDNAAILNALSEKMIEEGKAFDDGELVKLGRIPVAVINAADIVKQEYTIQASRFLGREDYSVMQVVIPDQKGLFPWDKGCDAIYRNCPVFRRNH